MKYGQHWQKHIIEGGDAVFGTSPFVRFCTTTHLTLVAFSAPASCGITRTKFGHWNGHHHLKRSTKMTETQTRHIIQEKMHSHHFMIIWYKHSNNMVSGLIGNNSPEVYWNFDLFSVLGLLSRYFVFPCVTLYSLITWTITHHFPCS